MTPRAQALFEKIAKNRTKAIVAGTAIGATSGASYVGGRYVGALRTIKKSLAKPENLNLLEYGPRLREMSKGDVFRRLPYAVGAGAVAGAGIAALVNKNKK